MDTTLMCIKLIISAALGGVIGLEREYHEKPAGFRTNIIICLGATIFTMVSLVVGEWYNQDPGRISAQIVTGVGFLGAGAILREGSKISGLTTAAGIWLVSAIGMAVGYGYYELAILSTGLTLLAQLYLVKLEYLFRKFVRFQNIQLKCVADWETLNICEDRIAQSRAKIISRRVRKEDGKFIVEYMLYGSNADIDEALTRVLDMKEIIDLYD